MTDEQKGLKEAETPKEETKPEQPNKPQRPEPLAGIQIQLEEDGQITRQFYGPQNNVTTLYGLAAVLGQEINAVATGVPGRTPTREMRLLSNVVTSITNMANVLMGLQAGINQILKRLEEMANDKPESERKNSPREKVSAEGPAE